MVGEAAAEPARNDHAARALGEGDVARHRAEREAEAVERGGGEAVLARHRRGPQGLFVLIRRRPAFDRGQRFVEIAEAHARGDALDRDSPVAPAQLEEDLILELIGGREVDMAALGLDDVIASLAAQQLGDAEAGAWADDADHAFLGKRLRGAAERAEMLVAELRDGMGDGAEIVDQLEPLDLQLLAQQRRLDHPGIVGELQHLALHRAGNGDAGSSGKGAAEHRAERFPGGLQARMLRRLHGDDIAHGGDPAVGDPGDGEPRVGPANVDGDDLAHGRFAAGARAPLDGQIVTEELVHMFFLAAAARMATEAGGFWIAVTQRPIRPAHRLRW
jgi:hypothetical protein